MFIRMIKKMLPNRVKKKIKQWMGVPENVPVAASGGTENRGGEPLPAIRRKYGNVTRIATEMGGGLGDIIVYLPVLDKLMASGECLIDFYVHTNMDYPRKVFGDRPNLSVLSYKFSEFNKDDYDIVLRCDHFTETRFCDGSQHILKHMPRLADYMIEIDRFNSRYRSDATRQPWKNAVTLKQAKFNGLNRWTYLSVDGDIFDMKEQRAGILIVGDRYKEFVRSDLSGQDYIIVSRGADPRHGGATQTKVWPKERYEEFIGSFKAIHPSVKVIQAATNSETHLDGIDGIILDSDLEDLKIILKNAKAFIGSEGGMAHLASQMSTPCVVVFGPTPAHYYGYDRNKNIVSPYCSDCMGAVEDWFRVCLRGHEQAECMKAITGDMVLHAVNEIFDSKKPSYFEEATHLPSVAEAATSRSVVGFMGKGFMQEAVNAVDKCHKVAIFAPDFMDGDQVGPDSELYERMSHNRNMQLLTEKGAMPFIANGFNIPKDDAYFDIVAADVAVQDIEYSEYTMQELTRVLKPDGMLLLYSGDTVASVLRKKVVVQEPEYALKINS